MSFQSTILPDLLIDDLYRKVLVLPPPDENSPATGVIPETESAAIKFLGNNLKHIVIVVNEASEVFLKEKHLEFLSRILAACKLNIGDVAIINEAHKFADITMIKAQLSPHSIILFGLEPIDLKLPLNFPHFKIQNYDEVAYLSVPALETLNVDSEEGKLLKTRLWFCLKTMFQVQNGS